MLCTVHAHDQTEGNRQHELFSASTHAENHRVRETVV